MVTAQKNLLTLFMAAVMAALLIPMFGAQTAHANDVLDIEPYCQGLENGSAVLGSTLSFDLDDVISSDERMMKRYLKGDEPKIASFDVDPEGSSFRQQLIPDYEGFCYWTLPSNIGLAGETFKIRIVFGHGADDDLILDSDPIMAVADISGVKVPSLKTKTYTGKPQTQDLSKIVMGETEFTEGVHYTVEYKNNTNVGTATVILQGKGALFGSLVKSFTINKAANPLKVKAKTVKVKYSSLKNKNKKLAVTKVIKFTAKADDEKQYALSSAKKDGKSFKKYFKVDASSGKVTVKKGLKKGKYKVKIKVMARGNDNYNASSWKTVTSKIKVV